MEIDNGGKRLVVERDELGRIEGLGLALGYDEGHRLAHVTDALPRERRPLRDPQHGAAAAGEGAELRDVAHACRRHVVARQHGKRAGSAERGRGVDRADARRSMGRAHENGGGLSREPQVVREACAPLEQGRVLETAGPAISAVTAVSLAHGASAHARSSKDAEMLAEIDGLAHDRGRRGAHRDASAGKDDDVVREIHDEPGVLLDEQDR